MNAKEDKEARLTLELLNAVDRRSDMSQRYLAGNMGVALGLANSYLKRCARKGYVKIKQAPANRYLYYLTPTGFAEKSRLTAKYLSASLDFYRQAAESCTQVFIECRRQGFNDILLCGLSDLAEIALLRAAESEINIVGFYDSLTEHKVLYRKPVWKELGDVGAFDIGMVTDLHSPLDKYQELTNILGQQRVVVPEILGLPTGLKGS
ncbi:winged helix-turn-helix transcriptional regulator [Pseudomonadota bacterium]